jgi:hypothetical protein
VRKPSDVPSTLFLYSADDAMMRANHAAIDPIVIQYIIITLPEFFTSASEPSKYFNTFYLLCAALQHAHFL